MSRVQEAVLVAPPQVVNKLREQLSQCHAALRDIQSADAAQREDLRDKEMQIAQLMGRIAAFEAG